MNNTTLDILIVGAGPAGLCLANLLQSYGQKFSIIDAKNSPDNLSKATGIHRNTLKLLDKINLATEIAKKSIELNANNMYMNGSLTKKVCFQQGEESNDKNLSISQPILEKILIESLTSKKCIIDFGRKLTNFKQHNDSVSVKIENTFTSEIETREVKYLIGCDGSKSTVRKIADLTFEGETTLEWSFTFDAMTNGDLNHNEMHMYTKDISRLIVVPIPNDKFFKFSGRITDQWYTEHAIKYMQMNETSKMHSELSKLVFERSNIQIINESITGLSFYHTASRLASSMHKRRVFLIGDAAHVFFPAGGYGLNAAIEDAFSLAFRLALIKKSIFNSSILSMFNMERMQNALEIKNDSNQKKQDSEKLISQEKTSIELENQIYQQKLHQIFCIRLESILSIGSLNKIKNKQKSLSQIINKNPGFTLIVNTKSEEIFNKIKILKTKLDSHIPIEVVHVCEGSCNFSLEDCFKFSSPDSFFTKNSERLIFIRPDNFVSIIKTNSSELEIEHLLGNFSLKSELS